MLQAGADALEEDPLARLGLSNNAHVQVVRAVMGLAPRLVVTGGGGYNPHSAGRCWAAIWAALNGIEIPDRATAEAQAVLAELRYARPGRGAMPAHLLATLRDPPREGLVRPEVRRLAALALREETA
jgi:acetoin utilization protein AcuC